MVLKLVFCQRPPWRLARLDYINQLPPGFLLHLEVVLGQESFDHVVQVLLLLRTDPLLLTETE